MIDNSNDEVNFPHRLLLTDSQVENLGKGFTNNLSVNMKLSQTKLSKIIQLGGFLGILLGAVMKVGLLLMKNVLQPLAKSVLIPLELTIAASAAGAGIHKFLLVKADLMILEPSVQEQQNQ